MLIKLRAQRVRTEICSATMFCPKYIILVGLLTILFFKAKDDPFYTVEISFLPRLAVKYLACTSSAGKAGK